MITRFDINRNNRMSPVYLQIRNAIRRSILDKELLPGFQLPSERSLAGQLGIHRNTVIKAYSELIKEGLIETSSSPRGYFVVTTDADQVIGKLEKGRFCSFDYMLKDEFFSINYTFERLFEGSLGNKKISFAAQMPSPDTYPREEVALILKELLSSGDPAIFGYIPGQGLESLRNNISRFLISRGISANPSEIQIVSESGQALDYLCKLYLRPGEAIIAEEPLLPDTFNYFRLMGAKVVTVPVDENGMVTRHLESLITLNRPKFIYTIPDFHNPTATVMKLERRYELLGVSAKYGIPIIEESCDYEFRYDGPSVPPLKAMDRAGTVVYIDSFLYSFYPGARLAFMAGPKQLVSKVSSVLEMEQICLNSMSQYMLAEYIERGYFKENLSALRRHYREKRDVMCAGLKALEGVEFLYPSGGTCVWCRLPDEIDQVLLLDEAMRLGVSFVPGFLFYPYGNCGENYVRLSFSSSPLEDICKGIELFSMALGRSRRK